ncbi:MAG: hypothetical protein ACJ8DW_05230, partial [Microvirga sp.]
MNDHSSRNDEPRGLSHLVPDAPDPSDPYRRAAQTFPALSDEQVARAAAFGKVEEWPAGTILFERGDRVVDFFVVLSGTIEI